MLYMLQSFDCWIVTALIAVARVFDLCMTDINAQQRQRQ
jgi:hypothetical protein